MRQRYELWITFLLVLSAATQCQSNDHPPENITRPATAGVVVSPRLEATATAPPSPTTPPTAAAAQSTTLTPVLTATTSLSPTLIVQTATAEPSPTPIIYIVEEGDTLLAIAIDRGTTVEEILSLNPGLQPALLQIGQQLILPAAAAPAGTTSGAAGSLPGGVEVTGVGSYVNPAGGRWILGEVANGGEEALENVQVTVDLLDASGSVLHSEVVWTANSIIRPGGRSPFGLLLVDVPQNFDHPLVTVMAANQVNELGTRYLDLSVTASESAAEDGFVRLSGEVLNEGESIAAKIVVVITLYDATGNVTGYVLREIEGDLAPGASSQFVVDIVPPGGTVEDFELTAEATVK
jgi:LysM repeat protein